VITRGQRENGGRCPNGTITVARAGDNLAWSWFGTVEGDIAIAFGTAARAINAVVGASRRSFIGCKDGKGPGIRG